MTEAREHASANLPVFASLWHAYRNVLGKPKAFLKIAAFPTLATAALIYAITLSPWWAGPWGVLTLGLFILPFCYLALAWLRHSLLAEPAGFTVPGVSFRSYGKLLGHGILWSSLLFALPTGIVLGAARLMVGLIDVPWMYYTYFEDGTIPGFAWLGLIAISAFLMGRLFLAAPAIVVGQPASPWVAWRTGKGQGIRLGLGFVLLPLSLLILGFCCLFGLLLIAVALTELLNIDAAILDSDAFSVGCFTAIVVAAALISVVLCSELLAITYRRITGWQAARNDILERFD